MSKQIITAETIRAAWKAGQSSIVLAPGDIVTQQARDDARQHGMTWKDAGSEPAPVSAPDPVSASVPLASPAVSGDARCTPSDPMTAFPASARAGLSPEQMVSAVTAQLQEALAPLARALAVPQGYLPGVAPASVLAPISYTPGVNPMAASAGPMAASAGLMAASAGPMAAFAEPMVASAGLMTASGPALAAVPAASTGPAAALVTPVPVVPAALAVPAVSPVPAVSAVACASANTDRPSADLTALTAEVRRRVLAALPAGVAADTSLVDQLIRKALSDNACHTCTCDACSSKGGSPVSETSTPPTGKLPGLEQAGGVLHVSSKAQSWGKGGTKDSVSMMDVLSPSKGAAAAVGYLEWDSLTFSWTFERPEVLVVLEGELKLTIEGTTLFGAAGDVFSIPKGVEIALASTGHVKCTTVGSVAA